MGVRILHDKDSNQACLYCSTSDWAIGPIFSDGDDGSDAGERAEAFCRWLDSPECPWATFEQHPSLGDRRHDARRLTDTGMQAAYSAWLAQEAAQMAREEAAEAAKWADEEGAL